MKLIEVQSAKVFAESFLPDIFFRMAVNRVLDAAPAFDLVHCKECKHYVDSPYDNGDMMCEKWGEWIFPNDDDFCSCGERKTE